MPNRRVHIVVHGWVQGVYFRAHTADEAKRLGVTGWVRNRPDGTVEAMVEGGLEKVAAMIRWLHIGSPGATVTHVQTTEEKPVGEEGEFTIRY
ncbi:MAG: acylphosphatase [Desulfobulbaceae bacterium]|nr:acylphosphatase [Desulfobulbaceae bacterium]